MILTMVAGVLFLTRVESETVSARKWWFALAAATAFGEVVLRG